MEHFNLSFDEPFLTIILKPNIDMIPWRGDSGLKDGCMEGVDLEGNISKHLFIFK